MLLVDQIALVTGATRGIGRAIAEALAGQGAHVVLTARHGDDAARAAEELRQRHGVRALGLAADVTVSSDVERSVREALTFGGGRIDVLVNNAGYPVVKALWDTPLHAIAAADLDAWFASVYDVDVRGARAMTHAVLPSMMRQGRGAIVYISSTPALAGYKATPYTEAKSALLGLMRDVALEYGKHGVRANALAPGNIRTGWADGLDAAERDALAHEAALGRWGEPEEVARAAVFLASSMASFITGQALVIDGGKVLR